MQTEHFRIFSQFRQCLSRFLAFLWVHFSLFYVIELALAPFPAALTLTAVWKWHLMTSTSKPPEGLQSTLRKLLTTHNISYSNYSSQHSTLHQARAMKKERAVGLSDLSEHKRCQEMMHRLRLSHQLSSFGFTEECCTQCWGREEVAQGIHHHKEISQAKAWSKDKQSTTTHSFQSVICQKESAQLPENCFAANQQDNQTMYIREILYLQIIREQHHKNHEEHGWAWLRAHCPCHFIAQHHLRRRKTNLGESDAEVRQAHHQPESNSKMQSKGSKYQDERKSNAIRCH